MPHLQIILGTTRRGRQGAPVGTWFLERAKRHGKFEIEYIDLADVNLPLLDEPNHPRFQKYENEHTRQWSATISRGDAYVFVTPEYDFSPPAVLLNAMQFLFKEWHYKPVAMVSYGGVSAGTRGAEVTKRCASALKMVPIYEAVSIPFFAQYLNKETGVYDPGDVQAKAADVMLDELLKWAVALAPMRTN